MNIISVILRGIALLLTLLITALIGNVIASNNNAATSATQAINFTMFVAAWAWLAAIFGLVAAFISSLALPLIMLPLEILAVLFTFISAIVLSAKLGAVDCGQTDNRGRSWIAYGSGDDEKRCREIQASTVFMWFLWATFMGCLVLTFMDSRGGMGGMSNPMKRRSKSGPNMAQVGA